MTLSLNNQHQFTIRCWRYLAICFDINFDHKPSITELKTELEKQVVSRIMEHYGDIEERVALHIMEDAGVVSDLWDCDVAYNHSDDLPEPDPELTRGHYGNDDTVKILKWLSTEEDDWYTPREVSEMSSKVLEAFK